MLSDHMVLRQAFNAETARNYTKAAFLGAGAFAVACCGIAIIVAASKDNPVPPPVELPAPVVLPDLTKQPPHDPAIQRSVTVFHTAKMGDAEVVSGWKYPNGAGKAPTYQYCYMMKPNADGTDTRTQLQTTTVGVIKVETEAFPQADQDRARELCVWFKADA